MALSKERISYYTQRLLMSRIRILTDHSFYGLLLMRMPFAVDQNVETAYTDGKKIVFGAAFLNHLTDSELDFVMMHEILHVVLQHCGRGNRLDKDLFNIACDIVVNSNILLENNMNLSSISIDNDGPSMHLAPNGKEGFHYTAEEVYFMFHIPDPDEKNAEYKPDEQTLDDHSPWGQGELSEAASEKWNGILIETVQALSAGDGGNGQCSNVPLCVGRMLKDMAKSRLDWHTILADFIRPDDMDYSFTQPDRRFSSYDLFLPSFTEIEGAPKNLLFMIDTSASMSDEQISEAYREIKAGINQFAGKLAGWLGFFDREVKPPVAFDTDRPLEIKKAPGGGGTSFETIFEYVGHHMEDNPPDAIIILTDGDAPMPDEKESRGIPVLWLINNNVITPSWGTVARMI